MQQVLRKRTLRNLRANWARYTALGLLIALGMYIVISLVGAADTVIAGTARRAEESRREDGEFTLFAPLTVREQKELMEEGITLEQMFHTDFVLKDGSTLRVYPVRQLINLVLVEQGRLPKSSGEAVLEKRYCEEHGILVGDAVEIGGAMFAVCGIGTSPDYESPLRNLSDSSVDSGRFGIAFLTGAGYSALAQSRSGARSEEYTYAYRLNGAMEAEELKDWLKEIKVSADGVEDRAFREYWAELCEDRDALDQGISRLAQGASALRSGMDMLEGSGAELAWGMDQLSMAAGDSAAMQQALFSYKSGLNSYLNGVSSAALSMRQLQEGIAAMEDEKDELMEEYFDIELDNLTQFLTADENPRIGAAADDQVISKWAGLLAGVIFVVLFTYVISVFVVHGIEQESSIIGALYALGVERRELLLHYLLLPVVVTLLGGAVGTALGYSPIGASWQMADCYQYFSIPQLPVRFSPYLLAYGMAMPPAAAVAVNCFVIYRRLSRPALSLLRKEQKNVRSWNLDLGRLGFIRRFQLRQLFREARTGVTVMFGMFIALLILMLGLDTYVMCRHISEDYKRDTSFAYMYTYKYPEKEAPKGGEAVFGKTLKKEVLGYNLDVTVLGISEENPYFSASVSKRKNEVVISSAMAQKYRLKAGDPVILRDEEENQDYGFTVRGITPYSVNMYAFMDIDAMRELFGQEEDYYNIVFSDRRLSISPDRLYSTTTREEIYESSEVFVNMMGPMVFMMVGISALIFSVVLYLMMKMMIDRSAQSIAFMKVFGYRRDEIRTLYLDGNFYMIAAGAALCLLLSKWTVDSLFPFMVANVACAVDLTFTWQMYLAIYGSILILYFLINRRLVHRLDEAVPADVLKDRE